MPRCTQALRVPHIDRILQGVLVHHPEPLHGTGLITIVRLQTLILAVSQPNGVNHERLTIPEPDGVTVPQWVRFIVGHVTTVIGVDAPRFALLLVDPPRL